MNQTHTLYQMLSRSAIKHQQRHALLFRGKYITYEQMLNKIDFLASGLIEIGLKKGDTITFALPNVFEAVYGFYASSKIGLTCHLVHPLTPVIQMKKHMKETGSQTIVILDTFFEHYKDLLDDEDITMYLVSPVTEFNPIVKLAYRWLNRKKLKLVEYSNKVKRFESLYRRKVINIGNINPMSTAVYLHSGGTSGKPKTIELSHHAINNLGLQMDFILDKEDYQDTHMLAVLPMFHGFGLCMGIHGMLLMGGVDTLMPKFNSKEVVKLVSKNRIHILIGVPSLFESLLREPGFNSKKMCHIEQAFIGGDYVAMDLKKRFDHQMESNGAPARLLEGYGLTEVVSVASVNTLKAHNQASVGKPLPGIDIKIKDLDANRWCDMNEDGEILIAGPSRMIGYLNDKEATNRTFYDCDDKTWVKTGDLGFVDEDGYVHYKQRLKRIIKVYGIPVLPAEIENFLMSFDEVSEVCAVSIPDNKKGHVVKLFLVWNHEDAKKKIKKIKALIKKHISPYAVPKDIVILDELPKTIIGKTNVLALEKMANTI